MKHICIYTILIFIVSCNNSKTKEFYPDGTLKKEFTKINGVLDKIYLEYYENGNLKLIHNYDLGNLKDSSKYYYEDASNVLKFKRFWDNDSSGIKQIEYYKNGKVKKRGYINEDILKINKWNFYKDNGQLDIVREYKIIDGKHHLNQEWKLNEEGDTLYQGSKYFDIQVIKDTIVKGEQFLAAAFLRSHLFKDKTSEILVCLPKRESVNFNDDFSNMRSIKLDTFYSILHDVKNQKNFKGFSKPYSAAFGKRFKNVVGKYDLRGFIMEYYKEKDTMHSTKMYFDIPIYIKDTIAQSKS